MLTRIQLTAFVLSLTLVRTIANNIRTIANKARTIANSRIPGKPCATTVSADIKIPVNIFLDKINILSRKATSPTWGREGAFQNPSPHFHLPIGGVAELRSAGVAA